MKIFGDGLSIEEIEKHESEFDGFTSNPSLMKKLGVTDYVGYCRDMLSATNNPVSLEILSDDPVEILREAETLSALGDNAYIKVPITNSIGQSNVGVIARLLDSGVKINVTAVFSYSQIQSLLENTPDKNFIISIFAGRIADSSRNPQDFIKYAVFGTQDRKAEVLWASTREVFNITQADHCGCDIITVPINLYTKYMDNLWMNLELFSLKTVQMFKGDADACEYII